MFLKQDKKKVYVDLTLFLREAPSAGYLLIQMQHVWLFSQIQLKKWEQIVNL